MRAWALGVIKSLVGAQVHDYADVWPADHVTEIIWREEIETIHINVNSLCLPPVLDLDKHCAHDTTTDLLVWQENGKKEVNHPLARGTLYAHWHPSHE